MTLPITAIHLLTYNQESIHTCIDSLLEQEGFTLGLNLFILLSDNKSTNGIWEKLLVYNKKITLFQNDQNYGFAKGHNIGIEKALALGAEYVFIANPDIVLEKDALQKMVTALHEDTSAGFATPKIYRADKNIHPIEPKTFDACGMYFNDNIRHLDRGSNQIDRGEFQKSQYVFGATGAALLLKKSFILDCKFQTNDPNEIELFDNSFFLYREDAELALRGQILGWNCRYVPDATVYHTRVVTPEKRKSIPDIYNLYSVRNRFLIQINNFSLLLCLICIKGFIVRNLAVILACLTIERSSFAGIKEVVKLFPQAIQKRRYILTKRRRSDLVLKDWFFKKGIKGEDILNLNKDKTSYSCSVVIINYNSQGILESSVRYAEKSMRTLPINENNKILVVDNNSSTEIETLNSLSTNDQITIIKNERNLGFAAACNQGFSKTYSDFVLILNPDVNLKPDTLRLLSEALVQYPELGAIGASLLHSDLSIQSGFTARRFPTLFSVAFELLGIAKIFPNNFITKNYLMKDDLIFESYLKGEVKPHSPYKNSAEPYLVEQPAGACLLIRREAFNRIGGFDERFYPAWQEDVDFCLRLIKAGYKLAVLSDAQAIHAGGYSLKTMSRIEFLRIWYRNLNAYWEKHGNMFERTVIKVLTKIAFAIRSLREK